MKKYSILLRFLITFGLLYIVYSTINKDVLIDAFYNANLAYLIMALAVFVVSNFTGAVQWFFLLKSQNLNIKFTIVLKYYLVGTFFNNFLPSTVGGDVVKAYKIIKRKSESEIIISSIVWDRMISLFILLFFSLISGIIIFKSKLFIILFFALIITTLILLLLILKFNLGKLFLKLAQKLPHKNVQLFVHQFFKSFKKYILFSNEILLFYATSVFTQFLKIFLIVVISKGFLSPLSFYEIYFFVPLLGILSVLPISLNGIGLREFVSRYFANIIHKNGDIISMLISVGNLVIIIGNLLGVFFIFDKKSDKNN